MDIRESTKLKRDKTINLNKYLSLYYNELTNNVIPFWENNSLDADYGGYFTCLDRKGKVFDTDKFMWLQGRQIYMFSLIYNQIEKKQSWLDTALLGADFVKKYGRDSSGNWYFSLTREGKPLIQPYNIFSDCFMAMGFGELYKATGNKEHKEIALNTYYNIIKRKENPKGIYSKIIPETRPIKNFSLPMILSNLALILEDIIGNQEVDNLLYPLIKEITESFYQQDKGLIFENILSDGTLSDSFEGRLINPGHVIEAMWFLMDIGERFSNKELIDFAVKNTLHTIEYGWDKEHGGIFYFLDYKGYPPQQLEWDQKLWWVHIETLIALVKGYYLTENQECAKWFEIIHNYTWKHFKDNEYPEWYGYLNRQGEVLLNLKGGKWKGCFHVPRGLFQIYKTISDNQNTL
ncbi:N-acylglucosamine 2-epimerase [Dysgonomonas hofstadii]|uniref:N-acylglucosamine 2-epimerase n=1 Tax=Dysgonomonas hofstadii TaxID=637886 RepID=A0A840CPV0_9BACT|nr:AGE family epimerase/isomerase [Dysgonomonas hofstadii]MBB4038040.1 N-acylglucosamine 2-epimerase [Dysgonomonas hofstadii]